MNNNQLIVAAAGSGKTTFLVKNALRISNENVLITTYTEANYDEIRRKIVKINNGSIPNNITIQTWFSFLLQNGVRPYQDRMHDDLHNKKIGFYLTEKLSGFRYLTVDKKPVYWGEKDVFHYYFTKDLKIYSDKISKFVVNCNIKTNGKIIDRISKIYSHIFVDEVQDLAGWDLEILKLIFNSPSCVLLVGDPRQVTYLTHNPKKYTKYKSGKIVAFINDKCKDGTCSIDPSTLGVSHRNNIEICDFTSRLFPEYPPCKPCTCDRCRSHSNKHEGVFLVKNIDVPEYSTKYSPTILRFKMASYPEWNFGKCKGLTFDRVLIYPTDKIKEYLTNGDTSKITTIREKFYVALTRARHSAAIVFDYDDKTSYISGLKKYK